MSKTDPSLAPRLASAPTYQAALRGQWYAPGMPRTPGFTAEHLRAAARADGIEIPSGYAYEQGKGFYDANADHWYSDPRVIGPIAIGAATLGFGALGAGGGAAAGAAGTAAPGAATAAGTGAGVAVPAAAAAGGAGVSGFSPLSLGILGGQGLLDYLGKRSQDKATDKALDLQNQATNRALDIQERQYNTTRGDLQPFTLAGTNAVTRLNDYTSRGIPAAPGVMPSGSPGSSSSFNFSGGLRQMTGPGPNAPQMQQQPSAMVTIQAPTGATKQVPASELTHWEARGARRVA